jgi:hypothetical protein
MIGGILFIGGTASAEDNGIAGSADCRSLWLLVARFARIPSQWSQVSWGIRDDKKIDFGGFSRRHGVGGCRHCVVRATCLWPFLGRG